MFGTDDSANGDTPAWRAWFYVNALWRSRESLAGVVSAITQGAKSDGGLITWRWGEIDVYENPIRGEGQAWQEDDGFLYYKFRVDIEPIVPLSDPDAYKADVSALLEGLWKRGFEAVVACDFEGELPDAGGRRFRSPN